MCVLNSIYTIFPISVNRFLMSNLWFPLRLSSVFLAVSAFASITDNTVHRLEKLMKLLFGNLPSSLPFHFIFLIFHLYFPSCLDILDLIVQFWFKDLHNKKKQSEVREMRFYVYILIVYVASSSNTTLFICLITLVLDLCNWYCS